MAKCDPTIRFDVNGDDESTILIMESHRHRRETTFLFLRNDTVLRRVVCRSLESDGYISRSSREPRDAGAAFFSAIAWLGGAQWYKRKQVRNGG